MGRFMQAFARITGWIVYYPLFRTKVYYQNKKVQSRRIKGKAIIISNHTAVYDFAVMLFTFPFRTLRYLMAEVLFKKKGLGGFLRAMGGIEVNRSAYDFAFTDKCKDILDKKGVVGVFPEGRLPLKDEARPLPFMPSAAYIALLSGAPIIPVYTNGSYFNKKRARVIIGTPIDASTIIDGQLTERENIEKVNTYLRNAIIELGYELQRQCEKRPKNQKKA